MVRVIAFALVVTAAWLPPARAQQIDESTFGPRIVIESIEVVGNHSTAARIVRRALPVGPGDTLRAGDARLREARFRILALGFFREVELSMRKGTRRGHVVLVVRVEERGTLVLDRIYLGRSEATPWWFGVDLGDRNFLGTGVEVGAGAVRAGESEVVGGASQWAGELRVGAPAVAGTRFGVHGAINYVDAVEPFRVAGDPSDASPSLFEAIGYRRAGLTGGVAYDVSPLSRLILDYRLELVAADVPADPVRVDSDGFAQPLELGLRDGESFVSTISLELERDTRPDPILPFRGDRLVAAAELGSSWIGSDYGFASLRASYERWFPLRSVQHVLSIHFSGGLVLGSAPVFDRFYAGDLNRLLTPRALGLVVSTAPSHDLFGTGADDVTYGEVAGLAELQYSYRLFRGGRPVYGGDLFVGAGVFGLAMRGDVASDERSRAVFLPFDLFVDIGLRLDTEIGIFELALANGLGRVPL